MFLVSSISLSSQKKFFTEQISIDLVHFQSVPCEVINGPVRPCIIRPIWMCVAVRVERKDTLVMHMFIYNTAFSLNEQIFKKKSSKQTVYTIFMYI